MILGIAIASGLCILALSYLLMLNDFDANSLAWPIFWLMSFFSPFVILYLFTYLFKDRDVGGTITIFLILGPFAFGLLSSIWAFKRARISVILSAVLISATLVAYCVGFGIFMIVYVKTFGVTAN